MGGGGATPFKKIKKVVFGIKNSLVQQFANETEFYFRNEKFYKC